MGVREDFVCDDLKTVPVPHLNYEFEYEEINCTGYNEYGVLKIPDLCEPTYQCVRWLNEPRNWDEESPCEMLSPNVFSHCSQCNMCSSIEDSQIKVRK